MKKYLILQVVLFIILFKEYQAQTCPSKTHSTLSGSCEFCYLQFNGCNNCSSDTDCLTCIQGFYHHTNTVEQCTPCVDQWGKCNHCMDSGCFTCESNFGPHDVGICLPCQENCTRCSYRSNSYECHQCAQGFKLQDQKCVTCTGAECCKVNDAGECEQCNEGYGLNQNNQCQANCDIEHCLECEFQEDGSKFCLNCKDGTYFDSGSTSCLNCVDHCLLCPNNTHCSGCKPGYFLEDHQCFKCSDNCTDCLSKTECFVCNDGYYTNDMKKCVTCDLQNCRKCADQWKCMECETGFYINLEDKTCQQCPENCTHCRAPEDGADSQCTDCQVGYNLSTQYRCILDKDAKEGEKGLDGHVYIKPSAPEESISRIIQTKFLVVFILMSIIL